MSTTREILTDALHDILAVGLGETPSTEDLAKALRLFNRRGSNWNTRERFKRFERMQTFAVTTSAQSYTLGVSTNTPTPTFSVAAGKPPVKITRANWLVGSGSPLLSYELDVIEVQEYSQISQPALPMLWPEALYHQKTLLNHTLWLVPYPTDLTCSLQLFWWDQFVAVASASLDVELNWPEGYELAFGLTLAEDLCIPFGKERSEHLKEAASMARADATSRNVPIPKLDTTGSAR